jgi:hypothetical protein
MPFHSFLRRLEPIPFKLLQFKKKLRVTPRAHCLLYVVGREGRAFGGGGAATDGVDQVRPLGDLRGPNAVRRERNDLGSGQGRLIHAL